MGFQPIHLVLIILGVLALLIILGIIALIKYIAKK